jgi:hypothetical protein
MTGRCCVWAWTSGPWVLFLVSAAGGGEGARLRAGRPPSFTRTSASGSGCVAAWLVAARWFRRRPMCRSTCPSKKRDENTKNGGDNGDNCQPSAQNPHGYWVSAGWRGPKANGDTAGTERGQRGQEIERRERFLPFLLPCLPGCAFRLARSPAPVSCGMARRLPMCSAIGVGTCHDPPGTGRPSSGRVLPGCFPRGSFESTLRPCCPVTTRGYRPGYRVGLPRQPASRRAGREPSVADPSPSDQRWPLSAAGPPWPFTTGVIREHVSRIPRGVETWGTRDKGRDTGQEGQRRCSL